MDQLLFDQSLKKLNVVFKYSGLSFERKIGTVTLRHRWIFVLNFVIVFGATIASLFYIRLGISKGKNFVEVTSVAPCTTFTILAIFKAVSLRLNEKNIFKLIAVIREMEKEYRKEPTDDKDEIMNADRSFLHKVLNVLYTSNVCMIVVFDMIPFILIAVKYCKTKEFEMLLPYLDVFEFIPQKFWLWPIAYVVEIWSEVIVLLEMGAADYLFFTCCTYLRIHFRLLKFDIEKLILNTLRPEEEIHETFCKLVKWHQDLIESSNILEAIYSKSNLFNFMTSSLVICLTGFNVTAVSDVTVMVTYMTFLLGGLMQVFFLCFFADRLMIASTDVSSAVYNCKWYLANSRTRKELLLVQTRSQEPCQLTAAGFAQVNLRAFTKVLSTAWSYLALLRTIYEQ